MLEAGSNWIAAWLDRLEIAVPRHEAPTPIRIKPGAYFCAVLISADTASVTRAVSAWCRLLGVERYRLPHIDALRSAWCIG